MTKTKEEIAELFNTTLPLKAEPNTDLLYAIAPFVDWDPEDQTLDAPSNINVNEFQKTMREHFTSLGLQEEIEKLTSQSFVFATNRMPLMNYMLYIGGYADLDDLKDSWSKGLNENEGYGFLLTHDQETVKAYLIVQKEAYRIFKSEEYKDIGLKVAMPSSATTAAVNSLLRSEGIAGLPYILDKVGKADAKISTLEESIKSLTKGKTKLEKELEKISQEFRDLQIQNLSSRSGNTEVALEATGEIPSGRLVVRKASDVFPDIKLPVDISVETYEWDGPHPYVPQVDPHYVMRPKLLMRVLYSLLTRKNGWVQGHTGSGKTTLIEQVCAVIGKPFLRVNLDSEMSRGDLVGKEKLLAYTDPTTSQTVTVSEFLEGILPVALTQPAVLCLDEMDFIRPDVAYVFQSITEGKGMRLAEDGGRWIHPHPEFHIFATANTVGQGDEFGMYQGARPQSMAFLDRFPVFIRVPYMNSAERKNLMKAHFPFLTESDLKVIDQYVHEHITAFERSEVIQPITPRGMLAIGMAYSILGSFKDAMEMTVLDKASQDDRAVLNGIVNRVFP